MESFQLMLFNTQEYLKNAWSKQIMSSLIIIGILCIVIFLIGKKIDKVKPEDKPPKIVVVCELIVSMINGFVKDSIGIKWKKYAPYILTVAIFLTFANLAGLTGFLVPPTSSWNVTLGLALMTFAIIHYTGVRSQGIKNYTKSYFSPFFLFFPINLIGEVTFPLSLSLRLFGNILSGCVISTLVYGIAANNGALGFLVVLVSPFMHLLFDVLFGMIQVAVFVLLSTIFIGQKVDESELIEN